MHPSRLRCLDQVRFSEALQYTTWGRKMGDPGQLLIGTQGIVPVDLDDPNNLSILLRLAACKPCHSAGQGRGFDLEMDS